METSPTPSYGRTNRDSSGLGSSRSAGLAGGGKVAETFRRPLQLQTNHACYTDGVVDSPTGDSDDSSMNQHPENATPPASPAPRGSPHPPAEQISRLSLSHGQHGGNIQPHRGRGQLQAISSKRSASTELPRPPGRQSPKAIHYGTARQGHRNPRAALPKSSRRGYHNAQPCVSSGEDPQRSMIDSKAVRPFVQSHDRCKERVDSGYDSMGCRGNSIPGPKASTHNATIPATIDEASDSSSGNEAFQKNNRYPGLILQPDSSPISQDQLAAEVKGIYAGLVMVEAKCINIDAAQAADTKSQLGPEQWQALIALHRTLLYEHHDFLMATQHPSATPALRGLATKYSMPARMWKHGIHAFLEVLRHRRPDSQDYMLAFIYLAYQMMALLFETVPSFTDTWIECLGDLARYRMAIEEEKEAHATWGGVAARWYTMASDRHPAIGRLYHHLGILERPSLRKLCFYAKSLTCVISFPNARDSLSTLCGPIVQDEQTIQGSMQSAEARIVTFHALNITKGNPDTIAYVASTAQDLLLDTPPKLRDFGAYLAITNTAALFEFGSPNNILSQHYTTAINLAMQNSRPSMATGNKQHTTSSPVYNTGMSDSLETSKNFWVHTFDLVLGNYCSVSALQHSLAYVHVMLVCVHSLHSLRVRLLNGQPTYTFDSPVDLGQLPWTAIAGYLNTVAHSQPISARLLEYARQGMFLAPERKEDARPLPEDYLIRGLIWVQFYFRPGWFDGQAEDDGRAIESPTTQQARMERVLWLGLYLAFHTRFLQYDPHRRAFYAMPTPPLATETQDTSPVEPEYADCPMEEQFSVLPTPSSRSSMGPSSESNSEDGWEKVKYPNKVKQEPQHSWAKYKQEPLSPKIKQEPQASWAKYKQGSPQPTPSWAKVAARSPKPIGPKKRYPEYEIVKVAGDGDEMVWSHDEANADEIHRGYSLC